MKKITICVCLFCLPLLSAMNPKDYELLNGYNSMDGDLQNRLFGVIKNKTKIIYLVGLNEDIYTKSKQKSFEYARRPIVKLRNAIHDGLEPAASEIELLEQTNTIKELLPEVTVLSAPLTILGNLKYPKELIALAVLTGMLKKKTLP